MAGISFPYTGFGTGFFDYDHDGDLDLAVVNGRVTRGPLLGELDIPGYWDYYGEPNMLFENDGQGRFRDVGEEARAYTRYIENSRGLAFGDIDNDGDIDFLVMNEGGRARLFRNDVEEKGNWLIVRAYDSDLQRDAIGAIITVVIGLKRLHKLIAPGYSYLSSSDFRAHFGLGDDVAIDQIIVQWPGGVEEYFPGVKANQIITLKKGQTLSMN